MKTKMLLTAVLIACTVVAYSQIIYVPGDYSSIQDAIDIASSGDTVLVDDSTYYENINFKGKAITVASNFILNGDTSHIINTIIDGSQPNNPDSASVVYFISGEDTTSVLYSFTIMGGTGTELPDEPFTALRAGGGILLNNSGAKICHNIIRNNSLTNFEEAFGCGVSGGFSPDTNLVIIEDNKIYDNTITGNDWCMGGGITLSYCNARIRNNLISDNLITANSNNLSAKAAGISYYSKLPIARFAIIENNIVTGNSIVQTGNTTHGAVGCGIYFGGDGANGKIKNNTITNNYSEAPNNIYGNGITVEVCGELEISNNIILSNIYTAPYCYGGGICIWSCDPLMNYNVIAGNTATHGGGLYTKFPLGSQHKVVNNTIVSNTALYEGGGVFIDGSGLTISNTILWDNEAPNDPEIYKSFNSTCDVTYSDIKGGGWIGVGNIDKDPLFIDPFNYDFHLTKYSPCIDAGDPASPPDPDSSICDIGAFFYDHTTIINSPSFNKVNLLCYPNPFSESVAIEYELSQPENVEITFFNHLGQQIDMLFHFDCQRGKQRFSWNAPGQTNGIYFVRVRAGRETATGKVVRMR